MAPKKTPSSTPSSSKPNSPNKSKAKDPVLSSPSPPPPTTTTPAPASTNGTPQKTNARVVEVDANGGEMEYKTGSEIRFYDDEVTRMHAELAKRDVSRLSQPPQAAHRRPPHRITVRGFLLRTIFLYTLIAYFFVCPNYDSSSNPLQHPLPSRAICRALVRVEDTLVGYEPLVRPYLARANKKLEPYYNKVKNELEPYIEISRPYYSKAESVARPVVERGLKEARKFLVESVLPQSLRVVEKIKVASQPLFDVVKREYQANLEPSVDWYSQVVVDWYYEKLSPHLTTVVHQLDSQSRNALKIVSPYYVKGVPIVKKFFVKTVLPNLKTAAKFTKSTYFNEVQPRLVIGAKGLMRFYKREILPGVYRYYNLYIAPQVDKISEKVFEYKTKALETESSAEGEKVVVVEEVAKKVEEEEVVVVEEPVKSNVVIEQTPSQAATPPPAATPAPAVLEAEAEEVQVEEEKVQVPQTEDEILEDFIEELRDEPYYLIEDEPEEAIATESEPTPESESEAVVPPTPEEQALLTAAKRSALEALEQTHSVESERLAKSELDSLVARLVSIRKNAVEEIPNLFAASVERIDDESDRIVGALGKYFAKAAKNDKLSLKEKVKDSRFLVKKGLAKVLAMYEETVEEIDQYRIRLGEMEQTEVTKAKNVFDAYVTKVTDKLRWDWSWLEDVTYKDWERFHVQVKLDANRLESFSLAQTGHLPIDDLLALESPHVLLDSIVGQLDLLVEAFEEMMEKIKIKGQHELGADDVDVQEQEDASPVVEEPEPEPASAPHVVVADENSVVEQDELEPTAIPVVEKADESTLAAVESLVEGVIEEVIEDVKSAASVVSSWAEPHPSFAPSKSTEEGEEEERAAVEHAYTVSSVEAVFASRLSSVEAEARTRASASALEEKAKETVVAAHETTAHDEL